MRSRWIYSSLATHGSYAQKAAGSSAKRNFVPLEVRRYAETKGEKVESLALLRILDHLPDALHELPALGVFQAAQVLKHGPRPFRLDGRTATASGHLLHIFEIHGTRLFVAYGEP